MTHSLIGADRNTHLKIVLVAVIGAITVVSVGLAIRVTDVATAQMQAHAPVVKAGKPVLWTRDDTAVVR
jgi:hypothetical protein